MKATARKLLALIMAMAMCLSLLQGVAFAAESSEAEAEAEVVDVVETKEEKKVEEQAIAKAAKIEQKGENGKDGFTITFADESTKDYDWGFNSNECVVVTVVGSTTPLVGTRNSKVYTATLKSSNDYVESSAQGDFANYTVTTDAIKLTDKSISWTALPAELATKRTSSDTVEKIQGSYYVEKETGKVYFKLLKVNTKGDGFEDASKAANWVYGLGSGKDAKTALTGGLDKVDEDGSFAGALDANIYTVTTSRETPAVAKYNFATTDDASGVTFGAKDVVEKLVVTVIDDGKFTVEATYTVKEDGKDVIKPVDTADALKAILDVKQGSITKVEKNAGVATYFDVTVAYNKGVDVDDDLKGTPGTNTSNYTFNGKTVIGLTDTASNGTYTNESNELKSVDAGKILYGPVVVTSDDADVNVVKGDIYKTVDELTEAAKNMSCKEAKTVTYKQLIMNAKVNGVENKGVKLNSGAYVPTATWTTDTTGVQVKEGSFTLEANANHFWADVVETKEATCQADGSKTTKTVCAYCGAEKAGSAKTEVIKKDSSEPVKAAKNEEGVGYVLKETLSATEYSALPATVKSYYTPDSGAYKMTTKPAHFISEYKIVDIVPAEKGKDGSYTIKYTCNYGCEHTDLQQTVALKQDALEHAGAWTYAEWGVQNAQNVRDVEKLYGFTPMVFDTDIESTGVPIKTAGQFFSFSTASKQTDGTYASAISSPVTVDVITKDAKGNKIKTTTSFVAQAVVKDIKNGEKECQDGAATIVLNVYKDSVDEKNLVTSTTKEYAIPAEKNHTYQNGKCTTCGAEDPNYKPTEEKKISDCTITVAKLTWTGKAAQPKVTVTDAEGNKLAKGIDYSVEEFEETAAGKYELVIAGLSSWTGRTTAEVEIAKASQTIKATPATKTVTAKSVKKKAATFTIKVTGKKNGAKLTYKSSNTKIATVSAAGKVTIKKGAKKGKAVITVQAKATKNVKASKAVKVTVTVK